MFLYLVIYYNVAGNLRHNPGWLMPETVITAMTDNSNFMVFVHVLCVYMYMCGRYVYSYMCIQRAEDSILCPLSLSVLSLETNSLTEHRAHCAKSQPSSCLYTTNTTVTQCWGYMCAQPHTAFLTVMWSSKFKSQCLWSTVICQTVFPSSVIFFSHHSLIYGH